MPCRPRGVKGRQRRIRATALGLFISSRCPKQITSPRNILCNVKIQDLTPIPLMIYTVPTKS